MAAYVCLASLRYPFRITHTLPLVCMHLGENDSRTESVMHHLLCGTLCIVSKIACSQAAWCT